MSLEQEIQLDLHKEASSSIRSNKSKQSDESEISNDDVLDDGGCEPLGYQHFLYDVNIEYSPGGNKSSSANNKHCFKMKYLPYMVERNNKTQLEPHVKFSYSNDIDNCDHQKDNNNTDNLCKSQMHIDVAKETCAFLGNSEYVPSIKFKRRRVVLELISAKLSQSTTYNIPANSSFTNLAALAENPQSSDISLINQQIITNNQSLNGTNTNNSVSNISSQSVTSSPSSLTSKKYVNYTILIKTAPGLDNHPAVIERRFSDFLLLYQGLKRHEAYARVVDKYVTFPKKIYMGNFSLAKIAERSVEFTRLLSLCMSRTNLLWSVPFVSFLIDKELKEAHRLSLFGDPDDVQALIETAYYIEQKLYLGGIQASRDNSSSSCSLDLSSSNNNGRYSPLFSNGRFFMIQSPSNETISADSNNSNAHIPISTDPGSSPNQSICDTSDLDSISHDMTSLNQRILVTFCMLFVVYCRGNNYPELKQAVQDFNHLISSQEYIDSLINTRHYISLRACLLFLMNLNQGNVIDESTRLWLKRRLEDIDGAHAELDSISISTQNTTDHNDVSTNSSKNRKYNVNGGDDVSRSSTNRVTKKDLTSLLRDRNFCSFQDGRFSR